MAGESLPSNPYWLDEVMLNRFEVFCNLCDKYSIRLIVGLITGFMSGRTFVPIALYGKNIMTDSTALLFEQRFVRGFTGYFKNRNTIYAWDIGNECSAINYAENPQIASAWTAIISNSIRASDKTRKIYSGIHCLQPEASSNNWTIEGQAEFCDAFVSHPYPFWYKHGSVDNTLDFRTLLISVANAKMYSEIGKKECLVEEIGTMGPMVCSDEHAAKFARVSLIQTFQLQRWMLYVFLHAVRTSGELHI